MAASTNLASSGKLARSLCSWALLASRSCSSSSSVWDACRVALTKNGLSVLQITNFDAADVWLETTLLHASGESISGRYPLRPQQQTPQGYGSALTYARRYALAAMVGVVADEDDDGNVASGRREVRDDAPRVSDAEQAAKAFSAKAIKDIGATKNMEALVSWGLAWAKQVEKLRANYPDEAKFVDAAIKAQELSFGKGA